MIMDDGLSLDIHHFFPQIPPSMCTKSSFTCIHTTHKIHKPFLLLRCTYFSLTHFCLLCVHKIYCLFYYYYAQNIQAYNRRLLFNHECCLFIHYGEYMSKKVKELCDRLTLYTLEKSNLPYSSVFAKSLKILAAMVPSIGLVAESSADFIARRKSFAIR